MNQRKNVLLCPLDWGLGHATRCIPIIKELLYRDCDVSVATSGLALIQLKKEFPDLNYYSITGYRPYYSAVESMAWSMAKQLPKFVMAIRKEHREIESIVKENRIDRVISDNRYGCWSGKVPSVIITHQLTIQAPPMMSGVVNFFNRRFIRKFSACWVPDRQGKESLAGDLSVADGLPVTYIGPLSRFEPRDHPMQTYEIIALVSGPEPQRTIFENLLRSELRASGRTALLVRGRPDEAEQKIDGRLTEVSHLLTEELNQAVLESGIVISRPGYSTIMDLAKLGKRAVFIPTPGQTEQEYLGKELMNKKIAPCIRQDAFDLERALHEVSAYRGFGWPGRHEGFHEALNTLLL